MAPTNPGGRPKLDWTESRNRKLGRLYLLTDITIQDIHQILKEDKFNPSVRSIQAQLSLLLPNNVKEWRQYRPTDKRQMGNRLAQLKRARQDRISKYSSSRKGSQVEAHNFEKVTQRQPHRPPQELPTPYYNPARYYDEAPSSSHLTLTSLSFLDIKQYPEAPILQHPDANTTMPPPASRLVARPRKNSLPISPASDEKSHVLPKGPQQPQETTEKPTSSRNSVNAAALVAAWNGSKKNRPDLNSLRSFGSRRTAGSIRSLQSIPGLLSSKMSICLSHVESVLSTTNSWKSSLIYAMSVSSDRFSLQSDVDLSSEEYRTWDELVDETAFASSSGQHITEDAISLRTRPCCEFFENDETKRILCRVCGFTEAHQQARNSWSDDGSFINCLIMDRFGNTPLHHAAAAGNTKRLLQLMDLAKDLQTRNTSGETFLHVLNLKECDDAEVQEVLDKCSTLSFEFGLRDYRGNSVMSRLKDVAKFEWNEEDELWKQSELEELASDSPLEELEKLAKVKNVPKKKVNFNKDGPDYLSPTGDTKLIERLRKWDKRPMILRDLEKLIKNSNLHMRARRGYTAIAIAVRYGIRDAVLLLLQHGANPNIRSYRGTSVLEFGAACLAKAQKDQDSALYARVLSCIVLIVDHGGKADPSVYDEFTMRVPVVPNKDGPSPRATEAVKQMYKPFVVEENKSARKYWIKDEAKAGESPKGGDAAISFFYIHE